ncbi:MAG TPA: type III-A CRISPR-associated protein Csm2 [Spirochaetota bacterium]|nr:type III-A CRISPR-associated protein Csm2 [Spirochaetota bacterium]HOK91915.1 type III-A CRISPR-associated protein Csm2 [Spirochaetota bacterium]HON17464.1 type III-A CRISPR-associated protein Csm2 [Spirochaetota bacterium]HPP96107.1 type III-A CRISPR-associated protein Csm2 [Spirochaetota bacterium]
MHGNQRTGQNQQQNQGNHEMDGLISQVGNISALTAADIDRIADGVGRICKQNKVKTNQIRNIYGHITAARNSYKKLKSQNSNNYEEVKTKLIFLKPKLAYSAGRLSDVKKSKIHEFYKKAIDGLQNRSGVDLQRALDNFFKLSEAIVAYHKYYE